MVRFQFNHPVVVRNCFLILPKLNSCAASIVKEIDIVDCLGSSLIAWL